MVTAGLRNRVEYVFATTRLGQVFYPQPDLETAIRWLENGTNHRDGSIPADGSIPRVEQEAPQA